MNDLSEVENKKTFLLHNLILQHQKSIKTICTSLLWKFQTIEVHKLNFIIHLKLTLKAL